MVFTAHIWKHPEADPTTNTKIKVMTKDNSGNLDVAAEFIEYGTQEVSGSDNAGRSFVTFTATIELKPGNEMWLDNIFPATLIYGPEQHDCEWMIYMYGRI